MCQGSGSLNVPKLPTIIMPMIPALDIFRSAQALVRQHGQDAPVHAAMRANAMLDKGDLGGYAVWKPIIKAVAEMQRARPGLGIALH